MSLSGSQLQKEVEIDDGKKRIPLSKKAKLGYMYAIPGRQVFPKMKKSYIE